MRPQFRVTLDGSFQISEPKGWQQVEMVLSRHEEFYSVIESVEFPLEFYGNNSILDGAYEYIKQVRDAGVDTIVTIEVEVSWNFGVTFEAFWDGILDLTELIEIEHKKRFQCTLMRNDKWSKFINRRAVPVDIRDSVTLDGEDASALIATAHTLNLPSQEIRKTFRSEHYTGVDPLYFRIRYQTTSVNKYGSIDLPKIVQDELENKLFIGNIVDDESPRPLFFVREAGSYNIQISVVLSSNDAATAGIVPTTGIFVFIRYNLSTPIQFNLVKNGTSGVDERAVFTYSATVQLNVADQIYLWFQNDNLTGDMSILQQTLFGEESYISIVADTIFRETTVPGFFIHDVARAIIGHTVGSEYFYSAYFGGQGTDLFYSAEGCGTRYRLFVGLNLRGKTIAQKPYSTSFDELWNGINPVFNLGAAYEIVNGSEVIRMEPKSYFFDESSAPVELNYVNNIEISYDTNFLLTSLEIGYQKWNDEVSSGNDDPQTKHTYGTRFKVVGRKDVKNMKILSDLIAASLVIEQGRRLSLDVEKDWDFDEEKFIVQTTTSLSPEEVKLYSNQVITGLQNAETRYNVRLTPASNFNRWKDFLFVAFQNYVGYVFRFVKGEGNTEMVFNDPNAAGCDAEAGTNVNEGADIVIDDSFLFLPIIYKFTHSLTWDQYKLLRDQKHKSLRVNYNANDGTLKSAVLFIKKIVYNPNESKAEYECWLKRFRSLNPEMTATLNGFGTWYVTDNISGEFLMTGPTDSDSVNITPDGSGNVEVLVSKVSNAGLAEGDGFVKFYKNGVLEPGVDVAGSGLGTQTFVNTQNIGSSIVYTFTGVINGDVLHIEIQEG